MACSRRFTWSSMREINGDITMQTRSWKRGNGARHNSKISHKIWANQNFLMLQSVTLSGHHSGGLTCLTDPRSFFRIRLSLYILVRSPDHHFHFATMQDWNFFEFLRFFNQYSVHDSAAMGLAIRRMLISTIYSHCIGILNVAFQHNYIFQYVAVAKFSSGYPAFH